MADSALPTDITFGYVRGRFVLAVADTTADEDRNPDQTPAVGQVIFAPYTPLLASGAAEPTYVAAKRVVSTLVNGYVTDDSKTPGLYLIVGVTYKVTVSLEGLSLAPFDITPRASDTEDSPLDLIKSMPLPPASPTQVFVVNQQVYEDAVAARNEAVAAAASIEAAQNTTVQAKIQTLAARDAVLANQTTWALDPTDPRVLRVSYPAYQADASNPRILVIPIGDSA